MRGNRIDPETERLICEAYIDGEAKRSIADRLGVSLNTVTNVAQRNNIPKRNDPWGAAMASARTARDEGICAAWRAGKLSKEIAAEFNVLVSLVYEMARKYNLPSRKINLSSELKEKVCKAYLDGEPTTSIGIRHGISQSTVSNIARRANLPPRRASAPRAAPNRDRDKAICEAYITDETTVSIAKRLGVSQCNVSQVARRYGLTMRNKRTPPSLERDKAICEAYEKGELTRTIANRFGVSHIVPSKVAKRYGLKMRGRNWRAGVV